MTNLLENNLNQNASAMEQVFARHAQHDNPAYLIADIIAQIRPHKPQQSELAVTAIQALCYLLNTDLERARILRQAVLTLLSEHKPISLFLVSRHSVFTGFF
ncbi:MAG: hypothetical protein B7Y34_01560, partial [Methylophilales bacterium 16-45-9]